VLLKWLMSEEGQSLLIVYCSGTVSPTLEIKLEAQGPGTWPPSAPIAHVALTRMALTRRMQATTSETIAPTTHENLVSK